MDGSRSAVGAGQLTKLPDGNLSRQRIVEPYFEAFRGIEELVNPLMSLDDVTSAYLIARRSLERNRGIEERGLQSSIHFPAGEEFSAELIRISVPRRSQKKVLRRELTLPRYPGMADEEVEIGIVAFKQALVETR